MHAVFVQDGGHMADKETHEYLGLIFSAEELSSLRTLPIAIQKYLIRRRRARADEQEARARSGGLDFAVPMPDSPSALKPEDPTDEMICCAIRSFTTQEQNGWASQPPYVQKKG